MPETAIRSRIATTVRELIEDVRRRCDSCAAAADCRCVRRTRRDDRYRSELQEGNLVLSPSPAPDRMIVMRQLLIQLDEQLPSGLQVGERFAYWYDFGDDWHHEILVESVDQADSARSLRCWCVTGLARAAAGQGAAAPPSG